MFTKLVSVVTTSLLFALIIFQQGDSCPCHTKRQAVAADEPTNSSVKIIDVLNGIRATNRLVDNTLLEHMPSIVYDVDTDNGTEQEALQGLAAIYQYLTMITTLQSSGLDVNTNDLDLYRLLLQAILRDTCQWLNAFEIIQVPFDCNDQELKHFIPVLLSLGLRSELKKVECYVKGFPEAELGDLRPTPGNWVNSMIRPVDSGNVRCTTEFCTKPLINLDCADGCMMDS